MLTSAEKAAEELAGIPQGKLKDHLNTGHKAKAFRINIYNTYVQYLLKASPELFNDRNAFFKNELITLAGEKLSLDEIEHDTLRINTAWDMLERSLFRILKSDSDWMRSITGYTLL
jgi:hypothetical protein